MSTTINGGLDQSPCLHLTQHTAPPPQPTSSLKGQLGSWMTGIKVKVKRASTFRAPTVRQALRSQGLETVQSGDVAGQGSPGT